MAERLGAGTTTGPPHVALVLATSTGGVGVHVASLARQLVATGWTVTVGAPESTHAAFDFAATGARVATVPIRRAGTEIRAVPAVVRVTRGAEVVHAHGLRAGTATALARRRPLVVTWHNAVLTAGPAGRVLALGERLVARRAEVNLGASEDLVYRIRELGGRDVRLAPVAPPRPVPVRSRAQVRAELGLTDEPLIVNVGRLHPQKGQVDLIDAAARWRDRPAGPAVVIAGDGPLRADLARRIETTGAPVRLLGHRRDVADLLAAADVVVLSSRWEARPLAVQEAMQLGRAVVATDVGGVAGLVGAAAVLVPAGDVDALDRAVRRLLDDPGARAELGRRAARHAGDHWPDEAATARLVIDVYRELLDRTRGNRPVERPARGPFRRRG